MSADTLSLHEKHQDWGDKAACKSEETDLFFIPEFYPEAKAVCARCEVREECLSYALRTNVQSGVWGGLETEERKRMRRRLAHRVHR